MSVACLPLDLRLLIDGQKAEFSFLLPGCWDTGSFCGIIPLKVGRLVGMQRIMFYIGAYPHKISTTCMCLALKKKNKSIYI